MVNLVTVHIYLYGYSTQKKLNKNVKKYTANTAELNTGIEKPVFAQWFYANLCAFVRQMKNVFVLGYHSFSYKPSLTLNPTPNLVITSFKGSYMKI